MSARNKLSVAFVWHMHQPFYKDLVTGEYVLPWVRLHATKDYYDMAAYLDNYPDIRSTFNVVPSLLLQIEEYANGTAKDKYLELTVKAPESLAQEEKVFILRNFFMANWSTMIKPYPRYNDLLLKRGRFVTLEDIVSVSKRFSSQELLDLQVWFNLAWFGFVYKNSDPTVKGLIEKGKNFNEDDKRNLIGKQMEIMRLIIPKYKQMQERGQIEVSVTPFYHPILPLLCDTDSARIATPQIVLPKHRFAHPEDAKYQVESAVAYYKEKFGAEPVGMWPSEGSVSEDIIPIVSDAGIKWIATDEEILSATLKHKLSPSELYRPYIAEKNGKETAVIFRDHGISDDIGFIYSKWSPRDAAADIISKLHKIAGSLPNDGRKYLASIILDGENAWEYYSNNGKDFFDFLYLSLSGSDGIDTVRVKDFISAYPPQNKLHSLFAGSWINHNFGVWIGHGEDNTAWEYLSKTREFLERTENVPKEAWQEFYIAEGSDWNWWYGDDHSSENDEEFDQLFRKHLINIYQFAGKDHPKYLEIPIKKMKSVKPTREPVYLIEPILDGEVTNYYEWLSAGLYSVDQVRGAMHQTETFIKNIYWGFSLKTLYLRIDTSIDPRCGPDSEIKGISFEVEIIKPGHFRLNMDCSDSNERVLTLYKLSDTSHFEKVRSLDTFGVGRIIEIGVDFADIAVNPNDEVQIVVSVKKDGKILEQWPKGGMIVIKCPDEEFESESWFV